MHYLKTLVPTLALVASVDALAIQNRNANNSTQDAASGCTCADQAAGAEIEASADQLDNDGGAGADAGAQEVDAAEGDADSGAQDEDAEAEGDDAAAQDEDAGGGAGGGARAIYFMTNQDENSIIMLPVEEDGTLGVGSSIATGGTGASLIDMMTGEEVATDSLASQSAIRVAGDNLFAVNAGSNSLSMLAIDPDDPVQLSVVGEAVETGGDFPTSVAVSEDLSMVCVAHNGAAAGVSCAQFDVTDGIGEFDELRPFDLQQTNPPTGPLNGIGMTFFNEDSSSLVTAVKGNPMDPSGDFPGFMSVFPIDEGAVGTTDEQTTPDGTAVLFGTALIPDSNQVLTTDGSFGSVVLDLDNLDQPVAMTELDGQMATCWASISELTGTGFVTDVGVNRLAEVDVASGEVINDLQLDNGNPGMIDLQSAGSKIYALAPGNGTTNCAVTVFDISGGSGSAEEMQNFEVPEADNRAMGMAFHE